MEILFLSIGLASGVLIGASVTYSVTILREKRRKSVSFIPSALQESMLNFDKAMKDIESTLDALPDDQSIHPQYLLVKKFLESQKQIEKLLNQDDDGDEPPLAGVPARPKK